MSRSSARTLSTRCASATTDENGIYALFVPAGEYGVTAIAEQYERYEVSGETIARPARCVSTIPVETGYHNYVPPGEAEVGNAAHCDIELGVVEYEPEAEVSVGEATVGTDFAEAVVPVSAKVVHYGQTATSAKVVVTLVPVDGGEGHAALPGWTKEFAISGDFDAHEFKAAFERLTAGEKYAVTAHVVINSDEAGLGGGDFAASREFVWFDESAASFTAAKWSGEPVKVEDGGLSIACSNGVEATFTPDPSEATSVRVVIKVRECGCYQEEAIPDAVGVAEISAVLRQGGKAELVVWGNKAWNATGYLFDEPGANVDVVVDADFVRHNVRYCIGSWTSPAYVLPTSLTSFASVSFKGYTVLSELQGTAWDANLFKDANGAEYANFGAAKEAGATGVLSPLWLSTWNLAGGSGTVDVKDPLGLITWTGESKVLKSETQPDGFERKWYAEASEADIAAGAGKYVKTTVDLGLAKAITDNSVVKIGDYLVANGEMSFVVEIDDVVIAKETVKNLVEVRTTMEAGDWAKPSDDEVDFKNGKVIVTPNKGGASGFARVKIPAS